MSQTCQTPQQRRRLVGQAVPPGLLASQDLRRRNRSAPRYDPNLAPATSASLTVHEYDALYGNQPGWEYWFGEARRKPVPTYWHGLLQILLGELLNRAGYIASVESGIIAGGIGLLHGYRGDGPPRWKRGFGVAHVDVKHEGHLDEAIKVLPTLPVAKTLTDTKTGRVMEKELFDAKYRAVVSLSWEKDEVPAWLLTSYEKRED